MNVHIVSLLVGKVKLINENDLWKVLFLQII